MHARVIKEAAVWAAVTRNSLSGYFKPPAKKEHPNTSSKFERMEPISCLIHRGQSNLGINLGGAKSAHRSLNDPELAWTI